MDRGPNHIANAPVQGMCRRTPRHAIITGIVGEHEAHAQTNSSSHHVHLVIVFTPYNYLHPGGARMREGY